MIISLSGAQCVGKSTLLNKIKSIDKFKNYCFKEEIIRDLVKKLNININEKGDDYTQFLIMYSHYKNIFDNNGYMVTDRCAIDCHVYSQYLYNNGKIKQYTYDESCKMVDLLKNKYDYIYYLPPEIKLKNDGFRSTDEQFRQDTHNIFLDVFKQFNINYVELSGSVEERMKIILNDIK